jgi:DNA-binding beta-propeller fold protein YncE
LPGLAGLAAVALAVAQPVLLATGRGVAGTDGAYAVIGTIPVSPFPDAIAIDPTTGTVYVVDNGYSQGSLSVINEATDAVVATVPLGVHTDWISFDPTTHTLYAASSADDDVSLIDAATCNAINPAGCPSTPPPTFPLGFAPGQMAIDSVTHTLYVIDWNASQDINQVAVIDAGTCNVSTQNNCAVLGTINVPNQPDAVVTDVTSGTLYVSSESGGAISVVAEAACDGTSQMSCSPVATVGISDYPGPLALDPASNTLYIGASYPNGVRLLDTATCNASVQASCSTAPYAVNLGFGPSGVAVDESTETAYVVNAAYGPSTVAVIDGTVCNALDQSNCNPEATLTVGSEAGAVAADSTTDIAYVANFYGADVSVLGPPCSPTTGHAACAITATATISGGTLDLEAPSTLAWSATLDGKDQGVDDSGGASAATLEPIDATGSGAGWNITAAATTFADGSVTLPVPALSVNGSSASPEDVTAPTANCAVGSTCTRAVNNVAYPQAVSVTPTVLYAAGTSTGMGAIDLATDWWLSFPADAYAGTYTSTITVAIASGP